MNKRKKILGISVLIIIVGIIGLKIYVNNKMSNVDWDKLGEKYREQERMRNEDSKKLYKATNIEKEEKLKYKQVNKLFVPLFDFWSARNETHQPSLNLFNVMMSDDDEKGIMSITSQEPHAYIEGLSNLSEYYNEKFERNLNATGLTLTSKKSEMKDFKGINANYEYYDSKYNSTGEENRCVSINFIYKDYAYNIFYVITPEAEKVIDGIELR